MLLTITHEADKLVTIDLIKREIAGAREEHRPVSRQLLADIVALHERIKMDQAWAIVDAFCDEFEPAVPSYLSQEFNLHWPKVVAVILAVAGIVVAALGVRAEGAKLHTWPYYSGATLLFGLGVLLFARSLERFQRLQRERRQKLTS